LIFITINLYNFILCILNNFLKTYLKIITEGFTDGIYPSAFDNSCHSHWWIYRRIYSVGIIHSPTNLPTDLIHRYLTVPVIMTNECTDGYLWSVFQTLTDKFTDGMYPSVCHTPSVKPSANIFFILPTDIAMDTGITDERKADGCILSVTTSVNKLLTNS
jgi:hypothetical protein